MAVSVAVCEIFSVKSGVTIENILKNSIHLVFCGKLHQSIYGQRASTVMSKNDSFVRGWNRMEHVRRLVNEVPDRCRSVRACMY